MNVFEFAISRDEIMIATIINSRSNSNNVSILLRNVRRWSIGRSVWRRDVFTSIAVSPTTTGFTEWKCRATK